MRTFSLIVTSLAALAAAAPAPAFTPAENNLVRRMEDSCTDTPSGAKFQGSPLWVEWKLEIAGAKYYTKDECGSGFLDNFRGRCGAITDWGCEYVPDTADAKMSFKTSLFCSDYDISQAIKAATNGERDVPCKYYEP